MADTFAVIFHMTSAILFIDFIIEALIKEIKVIRKIKVVTDLNNLKDVDLRKL